MQTRLTQADVDRINAKNAPQSRQDAPQAAFDGRESELHRQIEDELKRRRWFYIHSRTDKRSTNQVGTPDFIIAAPNGKTFFCEVKRKGGKLSVEQNVTRHVLLALGHHFAVVFSMEDFQRECACLEVTKQPPCQTDAKSEDCG
jgi:hypothetical protein